MAEFTTFGPVTSRKLFKLLDGTPNRSRSGIVREDSELLPFQIVKIGIADSTITAGGSGTVSVWRRIAGTLTDTTDDITAYLDWMTEDNISAGKAVLCAWFSNEQIWRIIGAECEDPDPPAAFQAGNANYSQSLTTTFTDIGGYTTQYHSGSAIVPTAAQ